MAAMAASSDAGADPIFWGPPVLAGGRLLMPGGHGRMAEVNPLNGELIGTTRLRGGVVLQPAVAGGALYLLTEDADVVATRGEGGRMEQAPEQRRPLRRWFKARLPRRTAMSPLG